AQGLQQAGAEGIVLCTNTMHKIAHIIESRCSLPFLHIADATGTRRFGTWLWTKELEGHNVLAHLGPEPLSDEVNGEYLQQKCAK
ncbi:hypothetical protein MJM28_28720, partial [Salmonella enterica subsp. enterica serovar Montevideo]|nr:hypothetical protein [Salmonella enterica subsp. enterica serovar Montevideo]